MKDIKYSAADYVGSALKVHEPLFYVGKLRRNKLNKCNVLIGQ